MEYDAAARVPRCRTRTAHPGRAARRHASAFRVSSRSSPAVALHLHPGPLVVLRRLGAGPR